MAENTARELILHMLQSGNKNIEEIAKLLGRSVKYVQRIIDEE